MGKSVHNDVLDAALGYVSGNGDELVICSAEPTGYAEAHTTYALGSKSSPGFTGPADGDASGRKLTVDAVSGEDVDATGTATHVALTDTGSSKLLYVTTLAEAQDVTAGNTFNLAAWDIELADPS